MQQRDRVITQYDTDQAADDYAKSYDGSGPSARFFRTRLELILDTLKQAAPGGDLLDAGCGPGVLLRELLTTRGNDFRMTALDQSPAMVRYCAANADPEPGSGRIRPVVSAVETMPFPDASFDVSLGMGVLEYSDAKAAALGEISRVTRPNGLVIISMLNPCSVYRLTEWLIYWPARRYLGALEKMVGIPASRRHGSMRTGIRPLLPGQLRRLMRKSGLRPGRPVYFDVTVLVPPLDRVPSLVQSAEKVHASRLVAGWRRRWLGSGYLVVARRGR